MRILVYGAGVQGSELAHRLLQNEKNVVTLLTRGERKDAIDEKGLIIRHWAQRTMRAAARAGRSSVSMPGSASPSAVPRPPFPACSASGCRLLLTA